jgi:hypothetical protein
MNTTSVSTTMIPKAIEHDYMVLYVLLWLLGLPIICFGLAVCHNKGFCSFKRHISPQPIEECEFRNESGDYYYSGL